MATPIGQQAETYSKENFSQGEMRARLGVYQGNYYWTDPQGKILEGANAYVNSGPASSSAIKTAAASGMDRGQIEQAQAAQSTAELENRNKAYAAYEKGDARALEQAGVTTERYAQIKPERSGLIGGGVKEAVFEAGIGPSGIGMSRNQLALDSYNTQREKVSEGMKDRPDLGRDAEGKYTPYTPYYSAGFTVSPVYGAGAGKSVSSTTPKGYNPDEASYINARGRMIGQPDLGDAAAKGNLMAGQKGLYDQFKKDYETTMAKPSAVKSKQDEGLPASRTNIKTGATEYSTPSGWQEGPKEVYGPFKPKYEEGGLNMSIEKSPYGFTLQAGKGLLKTPSGEYITSPFGIGAQANKPQEIQLTYAKPPEVERVNDTQYKSIMAGLEGQKGAGITAMGGLGFSGVGTSRKTSGQESTVAEGFAYVPPKPSDDNGPYYSVPVSILGLNLRNAIFSSDKNAPASARIAEQYEEGTARVTAGGKKLLDTLPTPFFPVPFPTKTGFVNLGEGGKYIVEQGIALASTTGFGVASYIDVGANTAAQFISVMNPPKETTLSGSKGLQARSLEAQESVKVSAFPVAALAAGGAAFSVLPLAPKFLAGKIPLSMFGRNIITLPETKAGQFVAEKVSEGTVKTGLIAGFAASDFPRSSKNFTDIPAGITQTAILGGVMGLGVSSKFSPVKYGETTTIGRGRIFIERTSITEKQPASIQPSDTVAGEFQQIPRQPMKVSSGGTAFLEVETTLPRSLYNIVPLSPKVVKQSSVVDIGQTSRASEFQLGKIPVKQTLTQSEVEITGRGGPIAFKLQETELPTIFTQRGKGSYGGGLDFNIGMTKEGLPPSAGLKSAEYTTPPQIPKTIVPRTPQIEILGIPEKQIRYMPYENPVSVTGPPQAIDYSTYKLPAQTQVRSVVGSYGATQPVDLMAEVTPEIAGPDMWQQTSTALGRSEIEIMLGTKGKQTPSGVFVQNPMMGKEIQVGNIKLGPQEAEFAGGLGFVRKTKTTADYYQINALSLEGGKVSESTFNIRDLVQSGDRLIYQGKGMEIEVSGLSKNTGQTIALPENVVFPKIPKKLTLGGKTPKEFIGGPVTLSTILSPSGLKPKPYSPEIGKGITATFGEPSLPTRGGAVEVTKTQTAEATQTEGAKAMIGAVASVMEQTGARQSAILSSQKSPTYTLPKIGFVSLPTMATMTRPTTATGFSEEQFGRQITTPKIIQMPQQIPSQFQPNRDFQLPRGGVTTREFQVPRGVQTPRQIELPRQIQTPRGLQIPRGIEIPRAFEIPKGIQIPRQAEITRQVETPRPPTPRPPPQPVPTIGTPPPPPPPFIPSGGGFTQFRTEGGSGPSKIKGLKGKYNPSLVAKFFNITAKGKAPKTLSKEFDIRPIYTGGKTPKTKQLKDVSTKFAFRPINVKGFGKPAKQK